MGILTAYPNRVRADATVLVVYKGQPSRSIQWSLTGSGILLPLSPATDASGRAAAKYTPGNVGDIITVGVTIGA